MLNVIVVIEQGDIVAIINPNDRNSVDANWFVDNGGMNRTIDFYFVYTFKSYHFCS